MNRADHVTLLTALADAQRENARELAMAVSDASAAGLSWQQIGEAVGIDRSVVFRQHRAGSPVSVLRPFYSRESSRAREAGLDA